MIPQATTPAASNQLGNSSLVQNTSQASSRPGHNIWDIHGARFEIPIYYQPVKLLGQGAYGIVIAAKDLRTNENIAIKKIPNAFQNLTDTKRTLREIRLLRHMNGQHENTITLRDILAPASRTTFTDIYLVNELMDTDLQQIIASDNVLTEEHCQYFIYQILRGLKFLHSANVLHRDLKPSNLLLNKDCLLKIADFGLARVEVDQMGFMTEYVATRWYRAPEVILSWKEYTRAIDVWSVGCILAELLLRRPLFQGKDYLHQIVRITDVLGTPSEEDTAGIANDQARRYIRSLGAKPGVPFERLLPNASPAALDLLRRMLTFNPQKRISVEDALSHPWLATLHDPEAEPRAASPFSFEFEHWQQSLTKPMYQMLIWQEMLAFHPEAAIAEQQAHDHALMQHLQAQLQQQANLNRQQAELAAHQHALQMQQQQLQQQNHLQQQQQQQLQQQLQLQQLQLQQVQYGAPGVAGPGPHDLSMDDYSAINQYMPNC